MRTATLHIHQTPRFKALEYFFISIGVVFFILQKLRQSFYFRTGLVLALNKYLRTIYNLSVLLYRTSLKFDEKIAKKEYKRSQKLLKQYNSYYIALEKINFFRNAETQKIAEDTLMKFHEIEAHVRSLAFSKTPKNPDDQSLLEFASQLSLGSL